MDRLLSRILRSSNPGYVLGFVSLVVVLIRNDYLASAVLVGGAGIGWAWWALLSNKSARRFVTKAGQDQLLSGGVIVIAALTLVLVPSTAIWNKVRGVEQMIGLPVADQLRPLSERLDAVDKRLSGLETRLDSQSNRIDNLAGRIDSLKDQISNLHQDTQRGFDEFMGRWSPSASPTVTAAPTHRVEPTAPQQPTLGVGQIDEPSPPTPPAVPPVIFENEAPTNAPAPPVDVTSTPIPPRGHMIAIPSSPTPMPRQPPG